MTMPVDLILVRHGESEGNVAVHTAKAGDESWITHPEFREIHSSWWRLTDKGCAQAAAAGAWIKEHLTHIELARFYASPFPRAMETAGLLGLSGDWRVDYRLRERERGEEDLLTGEETRQRVHSQRARASAPMFWRPAGGESIADTAARVRDVCDTLHRECADDAVVIVCHGEVIESFRVVLEHLDHDAFIEWTSSKDPQDKIHNGQVVHYTRRDPTTGAIGGQLGWRRSIDAPTGNHDSGYQPIARPTYSDDELVAMARRRTRIINGHPQVDDAAA